MSIQTGVGVLIPLSYKQHTPHSHPKPWSKTKKKPRESKPEKRERLKRLENEPVPQLFQNNPDKRAIGFPSSGWTRTLEGFFKSSNNRKKAVLRNNRMKKQRFTRLININLLAPRHPALINRDFKEFIKNLEAHGLIGHWTIQINRSNVVHWHLLFVNCKQKPQALKRLVKECLAGVKTFPQSRVYADRVWNQRQKLDYVLQVHKAGYGDVINPLENKAPRRSAVRHDIYKSDRLLFVSKTGLHKNGTFGKFWVEGFNEKKIWNMICEETATVARNFENPKIRDEVHRISEYFGIPLSWVKWRVCVNPPLELLADPSKCRQKVTPRCRHQRTGCSSGLVADLFQSARHSVPAPLRSKPATRSLSLGPVGDKQTDVVPRLPQTKADTCVLHGLWNTLTSWICSTRQLEEGKRIRPP